MLIVPASAETIRISTFAIKEADEVLPLIREAYRRLGHQVEITILPAKRSIKMANHGKFDAELIRVEGAGDSHPNLIRIPTSVLNTYFSIVTRPDVSFRPMRWEDLRNTSFGIVLGVQHSRIRTEGMGASEVPSPASLLKLVEAGRLDYAALPRIMTRAHPETMQQLELITPPVETVPLYHYLHKSRADLAAPLDRAIKSILASATAPASTN